MKIRKAVPGDERVLVDLNAYVQQIHVENHPSFFKPVTIEVVAAWFHDLMFNPYVRIWIAEEEGIPVGYASTFLHQREETPFSYARRWIEIDQILVHPGFRQRGIGRELVQHILRTAHAEEIREVEMTSWCFNTSAHEAFQHLGFKPRYIRFGRESSETGE